MEEAMEMRNVNRDVTEQTARKILGSLLFRKDDVFKKVSVLSGGEKSRLALARLLVKPPNLLLMDEPTTHLDIASIDALLGAVQEYDGTLVFISHDVYFIRALAQTVLHVHSGRLTPYAGNYDYFLEKSKSTNARAALTSSLGSDRNPLQNASPTSAKAEKKPDNSKKRNPADLKKLRIEVGRLEEVVSKLEAKQNDLTAALEAPETYTEPGKAQHLNRELSVVVDELTAATAAWEKAAAEMAELEK
jgi:ATP-binding cassette subfamily F protein 3